MIKSQQCFKEAGIVRDWNLKDIIFDIDIENKKIRAVISTHWKRTKITLINWKNIERK